MFNAARQAEKPVVMPVIDLSEVRTTRCLMKDMTIANSVLRFKNTDQVETATQMFQNLRFHSPDSVIEGLDTGNVKYAQSMFAQCRNTQHRSVSIPELDFSGCLEMDNAFESSGITGIAFKNAPDKVRSAVNAFKNCFMLENMPPVFFKSIKHGKMLASNFNGDYSVIFDGCNKMIKNYRSQPSASGKGDKFDDRMDDVKRFYEDEERIKPMTDSRGYVIVKDVADAAMAASITTRREIKGIVIDKSADPAGLFSNLNIHIKSLDLNGRSDVSYMFQNCDIAEFGEIIGSENVVNAEEMFGGSRCSIYPPIRFPKCSNTRIFAGAKAPDDVPDVQYAPMIQEIRGCGMDVVGNGIPPGDAGDRIAGKICEYMFGDERYEWEDKHGERRVAELMYVQPLIAASSDVLEKMPKDEREFVILGENVTSNMLKSLLRAKPKGFVFETDYVKKCNSQGDQVTIFQRIKADSIPTIDFNGLTNCAMMFQQCTVRKFEGFENFGSVTVA